MTPLTPTTTGRRPTRAQRTPVVLFALQSPPLLQLLRTSQEWDLRTEPMGDHEGLAESAELEGRAIPGLQGDTPDIIVVCTPEQRHAAETMVFRSGKDIPIVWAAHNGYEPHVIDGWQGPLLTFSLNNLAAFSGRNREAAFVIRPHVPKREQKTIGALGRDPIFSMQNRPGTRSLPQQMRSALLERAAEAGNVTIDVFGQGRPLGFLPPQARDLRFVTSRGYTSCLPSNAGFGLAEHEALALGCPLVTMAWGDAFHTLVRYPGLCHAADELAAKLAFLNALPIADWLFVRRQWAEEGYDRLATHYSQRGMDDGIEAFVHGLLT